jgi:deoxyribodipyrimidine photolyase-related protein
MANLLILPNTLVQKKYIPKDISSIVVWEHPQYFLKYKYNKKRLVLHRASLQYYYNQIKKEYKDIDVIYVEFNKKPKLKHNYIYFDPIDRIKLPPNGIKLESPNFLINNKLIQEYRKKTKNFFFNGFYTWSKSKLNIIPHVKSQDSKNRKIIPKDMHIPPLPIIYTRDKIYIKDAELYVENNFPSNYGDVKGLNFPVTRETAKLWLSQFIKKKLNDFGNYQDYTRQDENYVFHSCLSSSINMGLLNPSEIISSLVKVKTKIPINSYEGLIRQYFWREYQRYCYIYLKDWYGENYFGNSRKLTKQWYIGTTGIDPVDDAINDAFKTGYLHHIRRLMIVANYMNLSGINHNQGRKWFTEFALDSYDWVMYQNLDMGFFASGGKTSRKPYLSSSNYIIKMSDYTKGEWSDAWDRLYKKFIQKNKQQLWKYRYHFPTLTKL